MSRAVSKKPPAQPKRHKLYRAINDDEFELLTPAVFRKSRKMWERVLSIRARGDLKYPKELDSEIQTLSRISRLERQYFTDNRNIAMTYARKSGGCLIEIEVPLEELIKFFRLEFQNFSSRKKNFEIVYVIDAAKLGQNRLKWKLKTRSLR